LAASPCRELGGFDQPAHQLQFKVGELSRRPAGQIACATLFHPCAICRPVVAAGWLPPSPRRRRAQVRWCMLCVHPPFLTSSFPLVPKSRERGDRGPGVLAFYKRLQFPPTSNLPQTDQRHLDGQPGQLNGTTIHPADGRSGSASVRCLSSLARPPPLIE